MNDLELLRRIRTDVSPAAPEVLRRARARLLRPARPARRPVLRLAAAGAMTLTLAAVGLFATMKPRSPATEQMDAAGILDRAALAAEHGQLLPARHDQFVFVESITEYAGERFDCDGRADQSDCHAIVDPLVPTRRRIWLSVDGTRDGLLQERPRSGAGLASEVPLTVCPTGVIVVGPDGRRKAAECTPQPAYLADLPTNAGAMLAYLRGKVPPNEDDSYVFTVAGDLIRERYLPPASLAAVFRATARVPGITVVGDAVDAAGRHGISVGVNAHGVRRELIFDRTSLAYLGERTITLGPNGGRTGNVTGQAAQLRLAIVDRPGQLP